MPRRHFTHPVASTLPAAHKPRSSPIQAAIQPYTCVRRPPVLRPLRAGSEVPNGKIAWISVLCGVGCAVLSAVVMVPIMKRHVEELERERCALSLVPCVLAAGSVHMLAGMAPCPSTPPHTHIHNHHTHTSSFFPTSPTDLPCCAPALLCSAAGRLRRPLPPRRPPRSRPPAPTRASCHAPTPPA